MTTKGDFGPSSIRVDFSLKFKNRVVFVQVILIIVRQAGLSQSIARRFGRM